MKTLDFDITCLLDIVKATGKFTMEHHYVARRLVMSPVDAESLRLSDVPIPWLTIHECTELSSGKARLECDEE